MNQHWRIPGLALAFVVALCVPAPGQSAGTAPACASHDPELLHCPPPEAPRVTGLGHAEVVLELEVAPDGSVVSIRLVSATGHPAWRGAVEAAVATWRYVPADEVRTRVIPFVLGIDAGRRQAKTPPGPPVPLEPGRHVFQHRFAEHPGLASIPVEVRLEGRRVTVVNPVASDPFPAGVLAEGALMFHAGSGQWIIGREPADAQAPEVGGCSDGPEVLDLEAKVYWTC